MPPEAVALREDTHGVIPYTGGRSLSLYQIEAELAELLDQREEIAALIASDHSPEDIVALEVCDKLIAEYFTREVRKVDGIARAIHAFTEAAEEAREESARIAKRAIALEAVVDRIKRSTIEAMQVHQVKKLETPTNGLRIQANGGKAPLLIEGAVTEEFAKVTVTLPAELWSEISDKCVDALIGFPVFEPNAEKIRTSLAQSIVCPECKGNGAGLAPAVASCQRCQGRGTMPAAVPGARMGERGVHLRIS